MAQTHDIEDVLSSIRRLVANEQAAIPVPPELEPGPMLVLAEEHRVTEPEDPFQTIHALAQEEMDGRDAEHFVEDMPSDVTAITGDLVDLLPEEVEDEATDWSDESELDTYAEDADFEAESATDEDTMVISSLAEVSKTYEWNVANNPDMVPDIEAEIAAMLDAEDAAKHQIEVETPEESVTQSQADAPETDAPEAATENAPEGELWAEFPAPTAEAEAEAAAPEADVVTFEADPWEPSPVAETPAPEDEDSAEPDLKAADIDIEASQPETEADPLDEPSLGDVDLSGLDLSEVDFDTPMANIAAGAVTAAATRAVESAIDLSDLSDAGQSEEALREMIAEIVRQELAGELGERITRNVRKLVRREIRQMMAAEEFE